MSYSLRLRPRALAEIETARDGYAQVEHGYTFRTEVEAGVDAIQAMPLRFLVVYETIHGPCWETNHIVVLAVLPQRTDPASSPRR